MTTSGLVRKVSEYRNIPGTGGTQMGTSTRRICELLQTVIQNLIRIEFVLSNHRNDAHHKHVATNAQEFFFELEFQ